MSQPWMPLYVADFIADTSHLGAEETGAYMCLIMHYWRHGGLPSDEKQLSKIARLGTKKWNSHRATLLSFFGPDLSHKRVDAELRKSVEKSNKARASANIRHKRKSPKPQCDGNANAMRTQCLSQPQPHIVPDGTINARERASPAGRKIQSEFDESFWPNYPHKIGKAVALKSFVAARKRVELPDLMAGLRRYAAKTDDRPWCNPSTWLNGDRWADEPGINQPRAGPGSRNGFASLLDTLNERPDDVRQSEPAGSIEFLPPD